MIKFENDNKKVDANNYIDIDNNNDLDDDMGDDITRAKLTATVQQ